MHGSGVGGLAVIMLAAVLTNNILFSKFLGMCSFIAISRQMRTAVGMGLAVTFVTFCTALLNHWVYYSLLVADAPLCSADLTYLTFLVFIMTIAGFVQLVEMVLERFSPVLHFNLGIYLPLITVNCAVLGVSLFMIDPNHQMGLAQAGAYGLGSGLGWMMAICLMAGIRTRLEEADIPRPLRGLGITVIVTGLMALAFMGFAGMVDF
jgi:Na+-transporting NADH:ubiquinone oxidoreductase subunit E